MLRFTLISLFPEFFQGPLSCGQMGRAKASGLIDIDFVNPRDFSIDRYGTVDDKVYGGGPGMVLQCGPLVRALEYIQMNATVRQAKSEIPEAMQVWIMSPRGQAWNQSLVEKTAMQFSDDSILPWPHYVFVCGRYEGIDERFANFFADHLFSVGPYVLNGGETASLVIMESLVRYVPGVVGKSQSLVEESFSQMPDGERRLEGPQYTTPANFRGLCVPPILLSGHHQKIEDWKRAQRSMPSEFRVNSVGGMGGK